MSTTLIQFLQRYAGQDGLKNPGEIAGYDSVTATALISSNIAVAYNAGSGAGTVVPAGFTRGQIASETDAQFEAAGGSSGNLNPSAAVQGYEGAVSIVRGRAVPDSEPWA
jgi:hypothetical protein